jgi:uroporphyrinogen-III decarboxylase
MTTRQRMLAALHGQLPDRIPWVPRLGIWYRARQRAGDMPARYRGLSLQGLARRLGCGLAARDGHVYRETTATRQTVRREQGREVREITTPVGTVRQVTRFSEDLDRHGIGGLVCEHWLKEPADYEVLSWLEERRQFEPTYERFLAYDAEIGDHGLPMVAVHGCPFYHFVEQLVGFNEAYYHLADHPGLAERLLETMARVHRERVWPLVEASPARLVLNGYHLCPQFTPPELYRQYVLDYYRETNARLHACGKHAAMHADADTSGLLDLLEQSGWDLMECFLTAPMARVTLREARQAWGDRIAVWGGIPSAVLSPEYPEAAFRECVEDVFDAVAPGKAFILGIADTAMPDSLIERIEYIGDTVRRRGACPVAPRS